MAKENKKKEMIKIVFLVGVVIFTVVFTSLILNLIAPQQVTKYKIQVIVGDHIGFDLSTKMVTFGMVPPSSTVSRHININNGEHKSKVHITASGELADWITVSANDFIFQSHESKTIDVILNVPANAEFGEYTGTFEINFLKYE